MRNYIHCPRNSVTPHLNDEQVTNCGLCDFCWYEYCFCWSEYCMNEWYEAQKLHESQLLKQNKGKKSKS